MIKNDINRLLKICLDTAVFIENADSLFLKDLGLGKYAFSSYMRNGVKAVIDMQNEMINLQCKNEILKNKCEMYEQIADDSDLEFLEDDDLKKIKDFIDEIVKEKEI